jgi:hypothetical protein
MDYEDEVRRGVSWGGREKGGERGKGEGLAFEPHIEQRPAPRLFKALLLSSSLSPHRSVRLPEERRGVV